MQIRYDKELFKVFDFDFKFTINFNPIDGELCLFESKSKACFFKDTLLRSPLFAYSSPLFSS